MLSFGCANSFAANGTTAAAAAAAKEAAAAAGSDSSQSHLNLVSFVAPASPAAGSSAHQSGPTQLHKNEQTQDKWTNTVESTEGVSHILAGREFPRWAPTPFGSTVSFTQES